MWVLPTPCWIYSPWERTRDTWIQQCVLRGSMGPLWAPGCHSYPIRAPGDSARPMSLVTHPWANQASGQPEPGLHRQGYKGPRTQHLQVWQRLREGNRKVVSCLTQVQTEESYKQGRIYKVHIYGNGFNAFSTTSTHCCKVETEARTKYNLNWTWNSENHWIFGCIKL